MYQHKKYKKILIAVDDLEFGNVIVDFISEHYWYADAQFKVLHVLSYQPGLASLIGMPIAIPDPTVQERQEAGCKLLEDIIQKLIANLPSSAVEGLIEEGNPKSTIVKLAQDWPADLIVMGSHGRRGLDRLLMGSVSREVVADAPCSLVILQARDQSTSAA